MREAGWVPLLLLIMLVLPSGAFDLFTRYPDIDMPAHLVGGALTAYFFHRLSINASRFGVFGPHHAVTHAVLVFCLVCTAAVLWECAEFVADRFFGTQAQHGALDTMTDLMFGAIGGAFFVIVFYVLRRKR